MNELRFCKDCRHSYAPHGLTVLRCQQSGQTNPNFLVTGEGEPTEHRYCSIERMNGNGCGPDAKLFEPALQSAELTFGDQP